MYPVYYNDVPVGTVCCRLETKDDKVKLYLMTMGILAVSEPKSFSLSLVRIAHRPKSPIDLEPWGHKLSILFLLLPLPIQNQRSTKYTCMYKFRTQRRRNFMNDTGFKRWGWTNIITRKSTHTLLGFSPKI